MPPKHGLMWCRALISDDSRRLHEALERLAQEAMGSLASRNSAQPRFDPGGLVSFLQAVQATPVDLWSAGTRAALLDKAASYIVHRIQLRHLIAVNRTDDIVAILEVYADLQHRSLTTQDLLGAFALQVSEEGSLQDERAWQPVACLLHDPCCTARRLESNALGWASCASSASSRYQKTAMLISR